MNNKRNILIFSLLFFALQCIDLFLTHLALFKDGIVEMNRLYGHPLFIFIKLGMVFVISALIYKVHQINPRSAILAMILIIGMYVLICLNNLYWVIK